MALAYIKARSVADALRGRGAVDGTVLGADTVCVHGGQVFGQPRDAVEARRMLRTMRNGTHEAITGLCLLPLRTVGRWLIVDRTVVRWGRVGDDTIERYVTSGQWRGKAGGYNLIERLEDGWPITCQGDPHTVMGLPMSRLAAWLGPLREMPS
jgi:septum formation protein